jgi:Domain of unknown function (DUF4932)
MLRRYFLKAIASSAIIGVHASRASTPAKNGMPQTLHEPTEIAWILAALSPIGRISGGVIRRDTPYFAKVEKWFGPVTKHPIFTKLGPDFNLPRLVGNAANYNYAKGERLNRIAGSVALWNDPDGDLFTKNIELIEDFCRRGAARKFLKSEEAIYSAVSSALLSSVDVDDMQRWLEKQFTKRPGPIRVFVSPLTDGWNWTNIDGTEPRIWVPAPNNASNSDPVKRFITVSSVFTEVDHIYVNPISAVHHKVINDVFSKEKGWASDAAWQNYGTPELVFNEYMTWAVFMEYARARMLPADFGVLNMKIVKFMQNQRGFVKFGAFSELIKITRTSSEKSVQDLYPEIIANCVGLPNTVNL